MAEVAKCETCADDQGDPRDACPESQRPCGHHCNHSLVGSGCDWCGVDPYGDIDEYEAFRDIVDHQPVTS